MARAACSSAPLNGSEKVRPIELPSSLKIFALRAFFFVLRAVLSILHVYYKNKTQSAVLLVLHVYLSIFFAQQKSCPLQNGSF
jgi:hypothetical protein